MPKSSQCLCEMAGKIYLNHNYCTKCGLYLITIVNIQILYTPKEIKCLPLINYVLINGRCCAIIKLHNSSTELEGFLYCFHNIVNKKLITKCPQYDTVLF